MPDSLTASLHVEDADIPVRRASSSTSSPRRPAGSSSTATRPGVRVSWAQHHGGPWPATNTFHTSVGVTAVRRFLRPLAWQDAPESLLPEELRDGYRGIPRRVDGVLQGVSGV